MRLTLLSIALFVACNGDKAEDGADGTDGTGDGGTDACDTVWFADADGDGYGDDSRTLTACEAPSGYVAQGGDCDDREAAANPGATEVCDGVDNDCNGPVDDDASDMTTWYADVDGDDFGDPDSTKEACTPGYGYTDNAEDCDDLDPYAAPGAPETCDGVDNDCDGLTDDEDDDIFHGSTWYVDADGDGYGVPGGAVEACEQPEGYANNELDCDDTDDTLTPKTVWYRDNDGDGYGEDGSDTVVCDPGTENWARVDGDCDDGDASLTPETVWYVDSDKDGFGDPDTTKVTCEKPSGYILTPGDCDDSDPDVSSGGTETWYDGVDDNCDGLSDYDADYDGFDSSDYGGDDCDDTDASVNPDSDEYCDGIDNNCDGDTDLDDAVDPFTFYEDADGDGLGDPDGDTEEGCAPSSGYVDNADDCDDTDDEILECSCNISSVGTPSLLTTYGSTYGQWMKDPLETLGEGIIWEMDSYTGSTLRQFDDETDYVARTTAESYTLTYGYDGTGAAIYDGYLYYNQTGTNTLIQWDIAGETVNDTLTLTGAGYRNTYHYQWGGYSDIDFAVDEQGLWVLYATSSNSGKMVISKIDPDDFSITDSWNTSSSVKTSVGNAFMVCGIMYTVGSYSSKSTTLNYYYDTNEDTDGSLSVSFTNAYGYNSMIDYNPAEETLYSWDYGRRVTYALTLE